MCKLEVLLLICKSFAAGSVTGTASPPEAALRRTRPGSLLTQQIPIDIEQALHLKVGESTFEIPGLSSSLE
jgi:hypothetical protein